MPPLRYSVDVSRHEQKRRRRQGVTCSSLWEAIWDRHCLGCSTVSLAPFGPCFLAPKSKLDVSGKSFASKGRVSGFDFAGSLSTTIYLDILGM